MKVIGSTCVDILLLRLMSSRLVRPILDAKGEETLKRLEKQVPERAVPYRHPHQL